MERECIDLTGEWEVTLLDGRCKGQKEIINLPATLDEYMIGEKNEVVSTEHLSRYFQYEGAACYKKSINIPIEWQRKVIYLCLERSRVTTLFIDGRKVGARNSLVCCQNYDVSHYLYPGEHLIEIEVDNSRDIMSWNSIKLSHIASEQTQTNWNGILGEINLTAMSSVYISYLQIYQEYDRILYRAGLMNNNQSSILVSGKFYIAGFNEEQLLQHNLMPGEDEITGELCIIDFMEKWSEFHPHLYECLLEIKTENGGDKLSQKMGLRDFTVQGKKFSINGYVTFLRGKHDACVFPLTGYAPMEKISWLKIFEKAKQYGINHYRFHSWCPPEATFQAADELGVYLQPELPYWDPSTAFCDDNEWNYFKQEALRILDCYGNHASFVMFSWGNELSGDESRMEELVEICRQHDERHLYAIGSNNFFSSPHQPSNSDYWTTFWTDGEWNNKRPEYGGKGVRASTPHHTRGHINNNPPSTMKNYNWEIEQTIIPVISHEAGQYQSFPDFEEIKKYKGILRPGNLEAFRDKMKHKNMLSSNKDFAEYSGRLAVQCYKEELEAALRTSKLAGIQLLDLQDYLGQGTALIGVLDAFMEDKSFIRSIDWKSFCCETVLLAEFNKYIYRFNDLFIAKVKVAHYGELDLSALLKIRLVNESGKEVAYRLEGTHILAGELNDCGVMHFYLPKEENAYRLRLELELEGSSYHNHYTIWVFPEYQEIKIPSNVYVTQHWNEDTVRAAENGKRILWLPERHMMRYAIEGVFIPDFWCYPMFRKYNSPGTLGICCEKTHPALSGLPTENYSEWLWWNLTRRSKSMILDDSVVKPIVRTIDNVVRQYNLGLIVEGMYKKSPVIICGISLLEQLDRPEAAALYQSLLDYASGNTCKPEGEIEDVFISNLKNKEPDEYIGTNEYADIFG